MLQKIPRRRIPGSIRNLPENGKEFLEYYKMIEADLYHYFASIGINEQQQRQAVNGIV